MQNNIYLYLKKHRSLPILLALFVISVFTFDLVNYLRISPLLQTAKIQTITNPFKTELLGDNFEREYLKEFPIGTQKLLVVKSFEKSNFKIVASNPNSTGHSDPYFSEGMEYYWGMAKFPAGLINTIFLLGHYEIQVSLYFREKKLEKIKSYIFLKTI